MLRSLVGSEMCIRDSNVGLILNTNTGHISPQVHVVYDDQFQTVYSNNDAMPDVWSDLFQYNRVRVLDPMDDGSNNELANEWLVESEGDARAPMHALPLPNSPITEEFHVATEATSPRRHLNFDGEVPVIASQVRPSPAPPPAIRDGADTGTAASANGAEDEPRELRRSK